MTIIVATENDSEITEHLTKLSLQQQVDGRGLDLPVRAQCCKQVHLQHYHGESYGVSGVEFYKLEDGSPRIGFKLGTTRLVTADVQRFKAWVKRMNENPGSVESPSSCTFVRVD